jgi:hypothetical protein
MIATLVSKPPRRVPGPPEHIQEFLLCVLFHLLFPFVPLLVEISLLGRVERKSLLLFLAIYAVSIGVSSRSRLMFGITIVLGMIYAIFFGIATTGAELRAPVLIAGQLALGLIVLVHACERYNRHVVDRIRFWEFKVGAAQ